jgi:hypothetical protein
MSGILLMSVGNSYSAAPVNVVAPAVTGTATVGSTLTTTNGTWSGSPTPTFTYQWQRVTANISGETASTYVVQAADVNTTVRCVVTATNALGVVSANSNDTTIPLVIGAPFGGGFYAGQISTAGNSVADFNLIVGPVASAESSLQWKTSNTTTAGTTSDIDGPANSTAMNNASHPAAQFCEGLTVGGFTDWYMPAKNELEVCYYNLKPTTTSNNTGGGTNPNAVPARASNYTVGDPAQTSAADFKSTGAEDFSAGTYWTSTGLLLTNAKEQNFNDGEQNNRYKNSSENVRAVRRVAV